MKIRLQTFSAAVATMLLIAISSCKKDDGGSGNTIVGEWEARSLTVKTAIKGGSTSSSTEDFSSGQGAYAGFKSDNTYFYRDSVSAPNSETGTYIYTNNWLITKPNGSNETDTSGLVINGDQFTLTQAESSGNLSFNFTFTFARQK